MLCTAVSFRYIVFSLSFIPCYHINSLLNWNGKPSNMTFFVCVYVQEQVMYLAIGFIVAVFVLHIFGKV